MMRNRKGLVSEQETLNKNDDPAVKSVHPPFYLLWKTIAVVSTVLLFVTLGVLLLTSELTSRDRVSSSLKKENENNERSCPKQPALLDLPDLLPSDLKNTLEKLGSDLKSLVKASDNVPAISTNVFYKGKVIWSRHYGSRIANKSETPDDKTVYRIGSITKIFPVLLLFKLYEEGVISSVDDPLSKYVPHFEIKNPFSKDAVTLRQLANQMSGLPREAPCGLMCTNTNSSEQLLLLREKSLIIEPGTYPSYSNLAYVLLGRLLTENSQTTFEEWTTKNILQPLGMTRSGFGTPNVANMAPVPMFPMDFGWLGPAGDMYSTLEDLTKLGKMFAQPGKQSIFKEQTLRQLLKPDYITRGGDYLWGAPWEMRFIKGFLVVGKAGFNTAFTSMVPELQLGLNILMSMSPGTSFLPPVDAAFMAYSDILPALNKTLFDLEEKLEGFPVDPKPFLGQFQGTSLDPTRGVIDTLRYTITVDNGVLLVSDPSKPDKSLTLSYIGLPLILRSRPVVSYNCLIEHTGIEYGVYFTSPDKNGLSQGFKSTWMEFKRVQLP